MRVHVECSNKRCLISYSCADNNILLFWYVEINRCSGFVTHTLYVNKVAHLKQESIIIKMWLVPLRLFRCICLMVTAESYLGKMIRYTVTDGSLKMCHHPEMALQHHVKNESCAHFCVYCTRLQIYKNIHI